MRSKQTCLAVINVDSVLKKDKNYYLQAIISNTLKKLWYIIGDPEISSDESDKE